MNFLSWVLLCIFCARPGFAVVKNLDEPWAAPKADTEMESTFRGEQGHRGIVSADDRLAAEWGTEILRRGGNAVDAAVATAWMMAVTRPHYASIGGGGFLVFCPSKKKCTTIDYREMAPKAAHRDLYIKNGLLVEKLSQDGALASGIPGVVAGLLFAQKKYGKLENRLLLTKPIEIAKKGFKVSGRFESLVDTRSDAFNPEAKRIFGLKSGENLRQPDLARVLTEISNQGVDGFYSGWVTKKIVDELKKSGGIFATEDLKSYRPIERSPVTTKWDQYEVVSMGPPSSGGALLAMALRYAQFADKAGEFAQGSQSASTLHAIGHALALGFSERTIHFGDPDFVNVPLTQLLSEAYLVKHWSESFKREKINLPVGAGGLERSKGRGVGMETTHLSAIDRDGNAVALTTTVNDYFGSGFVVPGTGIVLNNEMDDFSVKAGAPNLYGLVGASANEIAPQKRPLSSMSPTIVRDSDGNNRIAIGAEGGPRIISSTFIALLNRLRFGMSLPDAVIAPRIHQQFKPETLFLEVNGFSFETRQALSALGWKISDTPDNAYMHAVERFPATGRVWGVADPRSEGAVAVE